MRPAGRAETDSLYFTYPHFDPPQDRAHLADRTPVAIAGAGPVGMTAALALARRGIRSVLLDAKATFNDGSRAICIARQSLSMPASRESARVSIASSCVVSASRRSVTYEPRKPVAPVKKIVFFIDSLMPSPGWRGVQMGPAPCERRRRRGGR